MHEGNDMELYDVVLKLVGPTLPYGNHDVDEQRLCNLKAACDVVDKVLYEISEVAKYRDRPEQHIREMADYADVFLCDLHHAYTPPK